MNEDYKYESKAEYELRYKGKEDKASILTNTLAAPLQEMRVFNEDNPWEDGWRNKLIFGDNLMALKTLYDDIKEGVDMPTNLTTPRRFILTTLRRYCLTTLLLHS